MHIDRGLRRPGGSLRCSLLPASCGLVPISLPVSPRTPTPLCSPFGDELGSIKLDFSVSDTGHGVSNDEAERLARRSLGIHASATTCSVRLAKYDNLSQHSDAVWVVHFDGLTWIGQGGPLPLNGEPPASPPTLRRALVLVTADAPATLLLSLATSP